MSGVVSAFVEAWQELRINKVRILLALVGVAVSVTALTSVVGVGDLAREGFKVQAERSQGRTATVALSVNGPTTPDPVRLEKAYQGIVERYGISYWTHTGQAQARFQFPGGVQDVQMTLVDPGYGVIHRTDVTQGSWFADDDEQRLAPAVVVSEAFYNTAGRPDLVRKPLAKLIGEQETTAVIIGVVPDLFPQAPPSAFMLNGAAQSAGIAKGYGQFKVWVQDGQAAALMPAMQADLQMQFPDMYIDATRMDYAAHGDPIAVAQVAVGAVAGLVLLLGAMGMLNISMVTIRYRVREIGIRRSFGATSGRIFVGVMMESLVATAVAGIVGVMLAVAVVKNPWIQQKVAPALSEYPPFPLEAAMLGFGAAVLVGALAGAIPALVAVRIKVIDAIRF
ncbi:ABC transporter permease [Arthrobacter cupressi]|uniref:Putative ABC transport system permease protein n=1 Tax=Arthrobacter cupressi TaxID=1045773 RepID=A0A1G8II15_9MICC|nr:ABC transporter permease [Arthrobacter cupressi]NYD79029.1 putative ABC transport system permease protein [Arthrobacter cupressi]SDI18649.1 putative ABC transport system permease protein [Arthrobacter cupressi]